MEPENMTPEHIFHKAIEIADPVRRAAFLDHACKGNEKLQAEVEGLLKAHADAGSFLHVPDVGQNATLDGPALTEGPGTKIGRYELLELIGEGGMGLVYLARQKKPVKRQVALKIIKPGMDSKQVIARFEAEKQTLAVLDHPNIAHVLDAGTTKEGRPFFIMEYVKGTSITTYCDENKLNIEQRLRLFEQVCEGVHYAHQKGIIHRDIKPSNILVSVHGDRAVPKIIDFGIAKAVAQPLTERTLVTFQGQLLGTPEYMSPEQVDLATQDIDTRSDIYSLGVVLYELLAGVVPFGRESLAGLGFAEIQRSIREQEPDSPSTRLTNLGEQAKAIAARRGTQVLPLARRLHRELEWIPLKAMRKDRCRRYKSASDMAGDVRNYLNGNPLLAGPETTIYRVQKFVRKHAGSVMTAALVAAVIVLGLVVSIWQATVATNAKNEALRAKAEKDRQAQIAVQERNKALVAQQQSEEQRRRAEASERQAQNLHYVANMNLAQQAWEQNHFGHLRQLLEETANYSQHGFEWYYWQRQAHPEIRTLHGHSKGVHSVAFSPDGRRVVTGSSDGTAKVWEVTSGKELLTLGDYSIGLLAFSPCKEERPWSGNIGAVAFSPDGRRIVTSGPHGTAKVWEANSGKELLTLHRHELGVCSATFSPDGQQIVTASCDGRVKIWDVVNRREIRTLEANNLWKVWSMAFPSCVAFSPDGQRVATDSDYGTAKVWDAASGRELLTLYGHTNMVVSVAFSPDSQQIVTGCMDGTAKIWDVASGKERLTLPGHRDGIQSVAFCPDGQRIVTGGWDRTAKIWDAASGKELLTFQGHTDAVWSVTFSPDGQRVVTGSEDGTAKIWEANGVGERILRKHSDMVSSVAFSPDSRRIVTGSRDGTAKVWEVNSGRELFSIEGHAGRVISVAFSSDGQRILTGSEDATAKVWDAVSGKELLTLKGHGEAIFDVAFSPDGQKIVTGSKDWTAKVWEAASGNELLTLKWHDGPIESVAFSPDGRQIVTGSMDGTARIWDVANGKELLTLEGHRMRLWSVAFSPDGQRVVTCSEDKTAKIWEVANGKELLTLRGHGAPVRSIAFSPDGRRVATGGYDQTAKIWEVSSGRELLALRVNSGGIKSVAFSPDHQRIATGHSDGTTKLWEAASPQQVAVWQQEERASAKRLTILQHGQAEEIERYKVVRTTDPGAIKQWLVLAPMPFKGQGGAAALAALDQQQLRQEAALHPRADERATFSEIERVWKKVQLDDNLINFNQIVGKPSNYSVAYAVCYIDSEAEQTDLTAKLGTGDALKVYLNEREIYRREWSLRHYPWTMDEVTGIRLKAGLNVLVLKVVNQINDWRASIRLTDAAGQTVKGIRATLDPPKEALP
jgi:WD40 repeat protein/tRNA A-37 threonylcarbamoyl transferase component Bud32